MGEISRAMQIAAWRRRGGYAFGSGGDAKRIADQEKAEAKEREREAAKAGEAPGSQAEALLARLKDRTPPERNRRLRPDEAVTRE